MGSVVPTYRHNTHSVDISHIIAYYKVPRCIKDNAKKSRSRLYTMGDSQGYAIRNAEELKMAQSNTGTEITVVVLLAVIVAMAVAGFMYWKKKKSTHTPGIDS